MRIAWVILSLCLVMFTLACKSNKAVGKTPKDNVVQQEPGSGAITEGFTVSIEGTPWYADTYEIVPMGKFYIVKGTASDASVFSIMLPEITGKQAYKVLQGGEVSVTYSTNRAKGFLFLAPFSEDNGRIYTEMIDGYLRGTFEVTINNGAISKQCKGMFSIKLP